MFVSTTSQDNLFKIYEFLHTCEAFYSILKSSNIKLWIVEKLVNKNILLRIQDSILKNI